MRAAVLREAGQPLTIEEVDIGKPGPREVLIRTAAAGVCHSDLHFIEGKHPLLTRAAGKVDRRAARRGETEGAQT